MGQFLGVSLRHSSHIGNIRNLRTQYVSPQWHVAYDELFETIISNGKSDDEVEAIFNKLFLEERGFYGDPNSKNEADKPPPLAEEWLTYEEQDVVHRGPRTRSQTRRQGTAIPVDVGEKADDETPSLRINNPIKEWVARPDH